MRWLLIGLLTWILWFAGCGEQETGLQLAQRIKYGMSKNEVVKLVGHPESISSGFHQDWWYSWGFVEFEGDSVVFIHRTGW